MGGEWASTTLGAVCSFATGSAFPKSAQGDMVGKYPFIKVSDMNLPGNDRFITIANNWVSKETQARLRAKVHPEGSTVFAKIGVALTYNRRRILTQPTLIDNNMMAAIPIAGLVDHLFFYYMLCTIDFNEVAVGTALPYLNISDLSRITVRLPSLNEQQAIACILGSLDDKIELNRQMNRTLEEMARAIFKSWFVDFDPVHAKAEGRDTGLPADIAALFPDSFEDSELGQIPKGWEVKRLADLCSTQYGYTASAVSGPIGPKYLRVTDINKRNWIEWSDVPYCPIDTNVRDVYALHVGDLVVARMADPGKSAIIEEDVDAVFASYLVRLKTASLAHSYYVYGFLKSDPYTEYAEGAKTGSVQANMNAKVIVNVSCVVPPATLMQQYANFILPLRRRLVANCHESQNLSIVRDTLLPKLLSGDLRVKGVNELMEAHV